MNIQLITGNRLLKSTDDIIVSPFSRPMALDDFDVDIIDLSFEDIWKYDGKYIGKMNRQKDLQTIAQMVNGTKVARIVYVYPQDGKYLYHKHDDEYMDSERIKNIIDNPKYEQGYRECFPDGIEPGDVIFEPTKTAIGKTTYSADFHFKYRFGETITESDRSKKITSIKCCDNKYFTTLNIGNSFEELIIFVDSIFMDSETCDIPEWVNNIIFGDDEEQYEIINNSKAQIEKSQERIDRANEKLEENLRYKSILYSNGSELVEVVFEILESILDCDLSGFEDKKIEDFRVEIEDIVFIGEIKGITSNVKNDNLGQLERHVQSYMDELEDTHQDKDVHAILIINPFRSKALDKREPVHEKQINLAMKYNSLIIETATLLKLFEMFQKGEIASAQCRELFKTKIGLLKNEDFTT